MYNPRTTYGASPNVPAANVGLRPQRGVPFSEAEPLKPQFVRVPRLPLTQKWVTIIGVGVLVLFVALPISDSVLLLNNFNYTFWSGHALPVTVISLLGGVVFIYFAASGILGPSDGQGYSSNNVVTLVSTFTTLLGVILVLTSVFLYYSEERITSALMYNCKGSPVSRDVTMYYNHLLALRETPACASKFSIEQCAGFSAAAPAGYSSYLKELELNYRCSGFCFTAAAAAAAAPVAPAAAAVFANVAAAAKAAAVAAAAAAPVAPVAPAATAMNAVPVALLGQNKTSFLAKSLVIKEVLDRTHRASYLPPALFSQGTYKTSCDGAASRNLTFTALSTSKAWWFMAIVLIGMGASAGLAEWVGGPKAR